MTINSETLAALIFLVFGAAATIIGWGYGLGTPGALGSGAVPVLAGGVLCLLGLVQLARALRAGAKLASAFARAELRPLILILGAVAVFGLLIGPFGLIPALVTLVIIAWFAQPGGRMVELIVILLVTLVLNIGIFHWGLGIPFRLFAWGL
jgi:hypothetical protein